MRAAARVTSGSFPFFNGGGAGRAPVGVAQVERPGLVADIFAVRGQRGGQVSERLRIPAVERARELGRADVGQHGVEGLAGRGPAEFPVPLQPRETEQFLLLLRQALGEADELGDAAVAAEHGEGDRAQHGDLRDAAVAPAPVAQPHERAEKRLHARVVQRQFPRGAQGGRVPVRQGRGAQARPPVVPQGPDPQGLGARVRDVVVRVVAREALGEAELRPVRREVERARVQLGVAEALRQRRGVAVLRAELRGQGAQRRPQGLRRDVRPAPASIHHEAGELRHQRAPLLPLPRVPSDMPVAWVEPVSPAAPERHRHPCAIPVHDGLAQRVARGLPRSEIVPGVEHRVESGDVNIRLNGYHAQRGSLLTCRVVHEDTA